MSSIGGTLAATDARVAGLGELFADALAPLAGELRGRPDRAEIEEVVSKITEAAQGDVIARLASLEETVLALAEALLRPSLRFTHSRENGRSYRY